MPACLKILSETGVELFNSKNNKLFSYLGEGSVSLPVTATGKNTVRINNAAIVGGRTFIKVTLTNASIFSGYKFNTPTYFVIDSTGFVDIIAFFRNTVPSGGLTANFNYKLYRC